MCNRRPRAHLGPQGAVFASQPRQRLFKQRDSDCVGGSVLAPRSRNGEGCAGQPFWITPPATDIGCLLGDLPRLIAPSRTVQGLTPGQTQLAALGLVRLILDFQRLEGYLVVSGGLLVGQKSGRPFTG